MDVDVDAISEKAVLMADTEGVDAISDIYRLEWGPYAHGPPGKCPSGPCVKMALGGSCKESTFTCHHHRAHKLAPADSCSPKKRMPNAAQHSRYNLSFQFQSSDCLFNRTSPEPIFQPLKQYRVSENSSLKWPVRGKVKNSYLVSTGSRP